MRIDLAKVRELNRDSRDILDYIDGVFSKCQADGDVPLLSDLISGHNRGGTFVMESLAHKEELDRDMPPEMRFRWKLLVKHDEWGNEGLPGDIIHRRIQKPLFHDRDHRKIALTTELSLDMMQGTYDQKWRQFVPFEIDEKGCIDCDFSAAASLIRQFGVHPVSKIGGPPMSQHLREMTKEPAKAPDGNMLHAWYWRYMEVDKEMYEKLPKLKKRSEPLRGFTEECKRI